MELEVASASSGASGAASAGPAVLQALLAHLERGREKKEIGRGESASFLLVFFPSRPLRCPFSLSLFPSTPSLFSLSPSYLVIHPPLLRVRERLVGHRQLLELLLSGFLLVARVAVRVPFSKVWSFFFLRGSRKSATKAYDRSIQQLPQNFDADRMKLPSAAFFLFPSAVLPKPKLARSIRARRNRGRGAWR